MNLEPVYIPIVIGLHETKAGWLYCADEDNFRRETVNIKMAQDAFNNCRQIIIDMQESK